MVGKVEKLHREILDYYGLLEHESICEIRHFGTGEEIYSQRCGIQAFDDRSFRKSQSLRQCSEWQRLDFSSLSF